MMDTRLYPKSFHSNKCDFCYQAGVPVKALSCRNHFYCCVCEKFAPKFCKRGDYSCNRCLVHPPRFIPANVCMPSTTKKTHVFDEVTCTIVIDKGNVLTFDDHDTDSENDLEGNNVEWDHLLESMTSSQSSHKVDELTKDLEEKDLRLDRSAVVMSDCQKSPTIGRFKESRDEKNQHGTNPTFVRHKGEVCNLGLGSSETEQIVEAEQERGSSPVKGIKKKSPNYVVMSGPTKSSDESYFKPLGDVEGPDFEPLGDVEGPDFEPFGDVEGPEPFGDVEGPDFEPFGDVEGPDPFGDVEGPDFEPFGDVEGPELSDRADSPDEFEVDFWAL